MISQLFYHIPRKESCSESRQNFGLDLKNEASLPCSSTFPGRVGCGIAFTFHLSQPSLTCNLGFSQHSLPGRNPVARVARYPSVSIPGNQWKYQDRTVDWFHSKNKSPNHLICSLLIQRVNCFNNIKTITRTGDAYIVHYYYIKPSVAFIRLHYLAETQIILQIHSHILTIPLLHSIARGIYVAEIHEFMNH